MKHHHSHTALLVIAASVTIFVYGLYGYMHHSISASLERVMSGRAALADKDSSLNQENSLASIHASTEQDRSKVSKFFIPDDATISFIESVEALGSSAGSSIALSAIEADNVDGTDPGTIGRIRVHVDVHGSWASVIKTLKLAENLPYAVVISRVRIDTSGNLDPKASRGREWKASFTIEGLLIRHKK